MREEVLYKLRFEVILSVVFLSLLIGACAGFRQGYTESRFKGKWLKVIDGDIDSRSGYKRLQIEMEYDNTIKSFVEIKGLPDYIHVIDLSNLELIYLDEDKTYLLKRGFLGVNSELFQTYPVKEEAIRRFTAEDVKRLASVRRPEVDISRETSRPYDRKKKEGHRFVVTKEKVTLSLSQLPQYENNFALIVGVSHYKNIPTLPYPEKDIGLMQEMATKIMGVKNNNLYVLRDPTKAEIISQIKKVTRLANCYNNSKVIFYFSGHGTAYAKKSGGKGEGYLLPIEADPEDISTTSVSLHEIEKLLARAKGEKVVIIDACFSGKGKSILLAGKPYIAIKKVTPIFHTTILLSSQETEISTYIKKKGISTFTYTLYEMLGRYGPILDKNKNGWVEAKEVTKKLRDFTDNYAVRFANKHQHPVIRGDLDISLAQHP